MEIDLSNPDRPILPGDYGVPVTLEGLLPWSFVEERMRQAVHYWVATLHPAGRPHTVPTWAAWLDGHLYLDGSPETRRFRNIAANPATTVHLESGSEVVIMEGETHAASRPTPDFASRLAQAYAAKYASRGYSPALTTWDNGGLYVFSPHKVFAWSNFPVDLTRWRISSRGK
jgi:hypothetical protein